MVPGAMNYNVSYGAHARHSVLIKVRREGVAAFMNGDRVASMTADTVRQIEGNTSWRLNDTGAIGLGTMRTVAAFHSVEVVENPTDGRGN
jgi:predicted ribosomally synthesized peptide with SipW-like signal peptide